MCVCVCVPGGFSTKCRERSQEVSELRVYSTNGALQRVMWMRWPIVQTGRKHKIAALWRPERKKEQRRLYFLWKLTCAKPSLTFPEEQSKASWLETSQTAMVGSTSLDMHEQDPHPPKPTTKKCMHLYVLIVSTLILALKHLRYPQ